MENDNSLLYACWINNIELIKEKLKQVKASQLKKVQGRQVLHFMRRL